MPRSACLSILVVPASASESDLVGGWRETRGIIFLLLLLLRPLQDDGAEGVCLSVPPSLPRWRDVLHLCTRTPTPPLFACVRVGIGACLSACLCAMPAGLSARPPGWLPSCRSTAPASSFSGWRRPRLARGASPPSSGSRKPPPICQTSWLQLDYVRHKK